LRLRRRVNSVIPILQANATNVMTVKCEHSRKFIKAAKSVAQKILAHVLLFRKE